MCIIAFDPLLNGLIYVDRPGVVSKALAQVQACHSGHVAHVPLPLPVEIDTQRGLSRG